MARQAILRGSFSVIFINETATKQANIKGLYLNETVSTPGVTPTTTTRTLLLLGVG